MVVDFTIQAYTLLAVYILSCLAVGVTLFFTIRSAIHGFKSWVKGSLKEGTPYHGALTS